MSYSVFLLIIISALAQNVHSENILEILTPPPFISTQSSHVRVIGKTDAPIVEIYLNDEKLFDLIVKDSIFHASVTFGYGVSEVSIIPIYSGLTTSENKATIEIMYGPEINRKFKKIFFPYLFHKTKTKDACTKCHSDSFISQDSLSTDAGCISCHTEFKDKIKKHTKSDKIPCIDCHLHDDENIGFPAVKNGETNLCFQCHKDKIGLFSQDYIHGPVAGGSCNICHKPHGSKYEHNLVNPEQILCFSCHIDLEEDTENKRVQHNPFKEGKCGVCHDPHSTSNKWVLIKSSEEVCLGCHNPDESLQWHAHPYNVKPKRKLKINVELNDKGNLECISCHNPHATDSEHLLRITEEFTCIGCHTDVL